MARCEECRRIRSSNRYTQLSKRVVAEEPMCWLQLDGCTRRSTTMDHIVPLHTDHSLGLVRSNCRGACRNCNTWRARRSLRQTAILKTRKRPAVSKRPAPRPALRPALRWFGAILLSVQRCNNNSRYPAGVHTTARRSRATILLLVQGWVQSVQRCADANRYPAGVCSRQTMPHLHKHQPGLWRHALGHVTAGQGWFPFT